MLDFGSQARQSGSSHPGQLVSMDEERHQCKEGRRNIRWIPMLIFRRPVAKLGSRESTKTSHRSSAASSSSAAVNLTALDLIDPAAPLFPLALGVQQAKKIQGAQDDEECAGRALEIVGRVRPRGGCLCTAKPGLDMSITKRNVVCARVVWRSWPPGSISMGKFIRFYSVGGSSAKNGTIPQEREGERGGWQGMVVPQTVDVQGGGPVIG